MDNPNNILWISILGGLISILGAVATIYSNLYKLKPDRMKTENEAESAIADAAESIASGAKISNEYLLARLLEMEKREKDRDRREEELRLQVDGLQASLADWQDWARRLVHQLKSYGHEPVPFKILPKTGPLKASD